MLKDAKKEYSFEEETRDLLERGEKLVELAFLVSGFTKEDIMKDLNLETGALIGGLIDFCKCSKSLVTAQAGALDRVLKEFEILRRMNCELCRQNVELQEAVKKIGKQLDAVENYVK